MAIIEFHPPVQYLHLLIRNSISILFSGIPIRITDYIPFPSTRRKLKRYTEWLTVITELFGQRVHEFVSADAFTREKRIEAYLKESLRNN